MVPYNSKFWTVPPEQMTCGWLDGFVPVPSLPQLIEGTVDENKRTFGYNAHFWYPKKGGINQLPRALAQQVKRLHLSSPIIEISPLRKEVKTKRGDTVRYDTLISTVPLPELPSMIKGIPEAVRKAIKKLKWNSIFNLNLAIDKNDFHGRHWVYFPDKEVSFFRVGFFHNFSADAVPKGKSSVYAEVSYSKELPLDKTAITGRIFENLKEVGILTQGAGVLFQDINDIRYGYPIYDKNYQNAKDVIFRYLMGYNIIPSGRYGSWRYMSMEDVLWEGKLIADSSHKTHKNILYKHT